MNNILNFPDRSRTREEAGYWLVRLDSGSMPEDESKEFHKWLDQSSEHRKALIELAELWDDMDILSELSDLFPLSQASPARHRFLRRPPAAYVLSLCVAVILTVAAVLVQRPGFLPAFQTSPKSVVYHTAVGELKSVSLADGSVIKLNTDTVISVALSSRKRDVRMLRGEAHFKVAHDPSRPFLVHAGESLVRAVGTAFSVRLKGADVEVMVTYGIVEIDAITGNDEDSASNNGGDRGKYLGTVKAGQTAEYGKHSLHSIKSVAPDEISRKLSWEHGTLVFNGETLEQVVREISRYTDTRIIISDPAIRNIRIGGYFKTGEVDTLLTVLKNNFSIRADRVGNNLIYLTEDRPIRADAR